MTSAFEVATALQAPWQHGVHVDARDAVLDDPLVLDGRTVCGLNLTGAHLRGGLSARNATFLGLAWFADTRIDGTFDVTGARFRIDLRAEGMRTQALILDHVELRGVLALARVSASHVSLRGALVMANMTLEGATVTDTLDLSGAELLGGLWAEGAHIGLKRAANTDLYGRRRNWAPD